MEREDKFMPENEEGDVIIGRATLPDDRRTSISLFRSGIEYMQSCHRTGIEFDVKTARAYDKHGGVPYTGCYFCAYHRGICERYFSLMREDADGTNPTIIMGQEQAKKQLTLSPDHDGLAYIKYVAQTGEEFKMARFLEIEAQFEGPPRSFTGDDSARGEKYDAECAYWRYRFEFCKSLFVYEKECSARDESWFYGSSASSSDEDEDKTSAPTKLAGQKRKREGVDKRETARERKKRKFYCLPLPEVTPIEGKKGNSPSK